MQVKARILTIQDFFTIRQCICMENIMRCLVLLTNTTKRMKFHWCFNQINSLRCSQKKQTRFWENRCIWG